jgi:hypothetical protein
VSRKKSGASHWSHDVVNAIYLRDLRRGGRELQLEIVLTFGADCSASRIRVGMGANMVSAIVFLFRLILGLIVLGAVWFVLDTIHDRNTEIIVSVLGLMYAFIFVISRRLQYFGLTAFSYFGRTASYVRNVPYDHLLGDDAGMHSQGRHLYFNVIFAGLIELLCLFRLFASLIGRGWPLLSDPIHSLLRAAPF